MTRKHSIAAPGSFSFSSDVHAERAPRKFVMAPPVVGTLFAGLASAAAAAASSGRTAVTDSEAEAPDGRTAAALALAVAVSVVRDAAMFATRAALRMCIMVRDGSRVDGNGWTVGD